MLLDGETLYDHVLWEVFNIDDVRHDREYLLEFFKLLVAYGGSGGKSLNPKPTFSEPIDVNQINNYEIKFIFCADNLHKEAHLMNPAGIDIGTL